jgi:hypothetical protein
MALERATITNEQTLERIEVMFNPADYSLDLSNSFAEIGIPGLRTPPIQYVRGNSRTLKMELFFDTCERRGNVSQGDVRRYTRQVTRLLDNDPQSKAPPILLFAWGGLNFRCVLESVAQRFTMFLEDGTPVRATLNVSFREYQPVEIEVQRGLFVLPPSLRTIDKGDTLSKLAADALGDPGAWCAIAEANDIDNPRTLDPGRTLVIPPREPRPPY